MKRFLALSLVLLLLLSGCGAEELKIAETTGSLICDEEDFVSADSQYLDLEITWGSNEEAVQRAAFGNMKTFYDSCIFGRPGQLTINYHYVGEEESSILIRFDGEKYTVTDEGQEKEYAHLIYSGNETPQLSSVDYMECFLLSDDPEMTGERYFDHLVSSVLNQSFPATRLLLSEGTRLKDLTRVFGDVPVAFRNIQISHWTRGIYMPSYRLMCEEGMLQCYNYEGKRLWERECAKDALLSTAGELSDGSVVLNMDAELQCYGSDGTLRWTHMLPKNVTYTEEPILQLGEKIFVFCIADGGCDDIYMCCLSSKGELLKERTVGGSDFESITRIEPCDEGIRLYGWTQSRDGDLPFSKDGHGVGFSLVVTEDLELKDIKEASETYYGLFCGWYEGKPIYSDDEIFVDCNGENDGPLRIFAYKDGYVTVRSHALGEAKFANPAMSRLVQYTELVFTGYSADGKLLWQNSSEIFVR